MAGELLLGRSVAHGRIGGKPVRDILILVEGGGDGRGSKALLRRGMDAFLAPGRYHKIRHAGDLLRRIDVNKVRERCRHCERLFNTVAEQIKAA